MVNFRIRQQLRRQREIHRAELSHAVAAAHTDAIMRQFEQAYRLYFQRNANITYHNGWYVVKSLGNFREHNICKMIERMYAELHEEELTGGV